MFKAATSRTVGDRLSVWMQMMRLHLGCLELFRGCLAKVVGLGTVMVAGCFDGGANSKVEPRTSGTNLVRANKSANDTASTLQNGL
jgi:hypothetical protein